MLRDWWVIDPRHDGTRNAPRLPWRNEASSRDWHPYHMSLPEIVSRPESIHARVALLEDTIVPGSPLRPSGPVKRLMSGIAYRLREGNSRRKGG